MSVTADQHFAIIPEWVLYADISATAVRLYGALRRYADKAGKAHPSRATLAKDIRVKSARTVDAALDELERIGAVKTEKRKDGRQFLSSEYQVISALPSAVSRTTPSAVSRTPLVQPVAHELRAIEPEPLEREKSLRERDPLFDALAEIEGLNLSEIDPDTGRRIGVALSKLKRFSKGPVTPGEIVRRAEHWSSHFHDATLTAGALVKWWPRLDRPATSNGNGGAISRHLARAAQRETT